MASSSPADPSPPPDPDDNPGAILAGALLHHRRDESRIRRIIAKNGAASFKSYNSHGKTALHRAAELSSRHLPILIAAAQPHIDQGDREGRTAVHYAAAAANETNSIEAMSLLLRCGASASTAARGGLRPVHLVARSGHIAAVRTLCSSGADIEAKTDAGETALAIAARAGHEAFVRAVLELLATSAARLNAVNNSDDGAMSPIYAACDGPRLEVLWLLIAAGLITTPAQKWFYRLDPCHCDRLEAWVRASAKHDVLLPLVFGEPASPPSTVELNRRAVVEDLLNLLTNHRSDARSDGDDAMDDTTNISAY